MTTLQSGTPLNVTISPDRANIGQPQPAAEPRQRGRRVQLLRQPERPRPGQLHRPGGVRACPDQFTYGNTPRNYLRGPKYSQTDVSFMKNFATGGRSRIQVRAEVFNLFNQVNWGAPGTTLGTAAFGIISSADTMRRAELGDQVPVLRTASAADGLAGCSLAFASAPDEAPVSGVWAACSLQSPVGRRLQASVSAAD